MDQLRPQRGKTKTAEASNLFPFSSLKFTQKICEHQRQPLTAHNLSSNNFVPICHLPCQLFLYPPSPCPLSCSPILCPYPLGSSLPPSLLSTFLPSISPQQITICLQPLGRTPQLFWLQLRIYLYQTMQRAGVSDLRLDSTAYIPRSDSLSSTLIRLNRCHTESRAELFREAKCD